MLWPTLISMAAVILVGVPFTYLWFRWSDRWADAEKKRFKDNDESDSPTVRVIKSEPTDKGGQ
ncbi:MAG: hypothetical protein KDA31_14220 [Phycisphaerales bacterium]|nr:hypothetical protein [Phycisphaerales bacterium]MCB9837374.1 hypothetical protein [Phycisphaera sp.]